MNVIKRFLIGFHSCFLFVLIHAYIEKGIIFKIEFLIIFSFVFACAFCMATLKSKNPKSLF